VGLFYVRKQNTMNTKNKVQLIGTVNHHPSVTRLESDILRATFKIDTPSSYINDRGMKTKGEFKHFCIAYGKLAEIIDRYVTDATEIAIEGILILNELTGKSHVQVDDLLLLSRKPN